MQLVYNGSLPKVHKLRVCVPPHFLAPSYAIDIYIYIQYFIWTLKVSVYLKSILK